MGCCLSRSATNPTQAPLSLGPPTSRRSNPPTTPTQEEETVKEVLTETPNINNKNEAVDKKSINNSILVHSTVGVKHQDQKELGQEQRITGFEKTEIQSAEIEVSDVTVATENRSVAALSLSVSVSESVSTVNGEKRVGEEVMSKSRDRADVKRQRSTPQSPARVLKRRPYSGEQTVAGSIREKRIRSPARRTVPSPERKTHVAPRAARGRSQSPATISQRSGVSAAPAKARQDPGERSGRRSRSPARHSSRNRAGTLTEVNARVNVGQRQHEEVCRTGMVEEDGEACPPADESLDNPMVSLECFIFL